MQVDRSLPAAIGPYRVTGRLGRGGMGEVLRGHDDRLDRPVALKRILPDIRDQKKALRRFRREARAVAKLGHPAIVQVHDWLEIRGRHWLVMEFVDGSPLDDVLAEGPLPPKRALQLARDITSGLAEAHDAGIIHRDLKTSNIVLTAKGKPKILDFGLAKPVFLENAETDIGGAEAIPQSTVTGEGIIVGTVKAMSPEMALSLPVDHRSDLFALGVLLYEITSGRPPFQGKSPFDTLNKTCNAPEVPLHELDPDIPQGLSDLVSHLLRKKPEDRPRDAHQVLEAIDLLLADATDLSASGLGLAAADGGVPDLANTGLRIGSASGLQTTSRADRNLDDESLQLLMQTTAELLVRKLRRNKAIALAVLLGLVGLTYWASHTLFDDTPIPIERGPAPSLVVLPSIVHGASSDQFLSDAIPNTISMNLAQVRGLQTKLPPSSQEYERTGRNMKTITDAYGASVALLPTVAVEGESLRLTLQLVDAATRDVIWAGDLEDDRRRFLDLSRAAAEEIRKVLSPSDPSLPRVEGSVSDSETALAFNRGLFLSRRYRLQGTREDFDAALQALESAAASSPERAEIQIEMARLHAARVATGDDPEDVVPTVRRLALRALELDPASGRAWAVLSEAEELDPGGSFRVEMEHALKGVTHASDDAYAHERLRRALGKGSILLSLEASDQVTQLEPLAVSTLLSDAILLAVIGRYDEARGRVDRALSIEPDMPFAILSMALIEILADDGDATAEWVAKLVPMVDEGRLRPDWLRLAEDYAALQQFGPRGNPEAEAASGRLLFLARGGARFPRWETATAQVAPLLARSGDTEEALELLLLRNDLGILPTYDAILLSPDLAPIRALPEFRRIDADAAASLREMLDILGEARKRGEYPAYLDPALEHLLPLVGIEPPW